MKKIRLALSLLMVCCCNVHSFVSAQDYLLDKMEPPFWYTGMKCQQLQIMVHGNKVGELEPVFQYSGVETDSIIRVPNLN